MAKLTFTASRRKLLGAIASAPVMTAPPVEALGPEDPHPSWLAEERRLDQALTLALRTNDEPRVRALTNQLSEARDLIITTPAKTLAGMAAVVRYISGTRDAGFEVGDDDCAALVSVADGLDRMAGRA